MVGLSFVKLTQAAERKPSREELMAAFERVTRSVPSPLHISAEALVASKPGTEEEIKRATDLLYHKRWRERGGCGRHKLRKLQMV